MNSVKRKEIFKRILWDYNYTPEDVENALNGKTSEEEAQRFYLKLLLSTNWYTLLKILSENELKQALSPEILNKIHIPTLRAKYKYAEQVLFG